MHNPVKASERVRITGKRKHLRASTREHATLILDGIGEISGFADDIGFGGVFFTADQDLKEIPVGSAGVIVFKMFNTLVDMNCRVASCRGGGLGIEIQRHYSTEDLKEQVRNISTEKEPALLELNDDEVTQVLHRTAAFLRTLATSSDQGYSRPEAELLANNINLVIARLAKT
ncbi:MAG: hypothetical protein HQL84_13105 [Magnetococcales bacterium]|nr:hypothetical protein [Magnetococcales bacterium]MBF0150971.1 hypothetical protein [Magnetococcales bacterium]MBF0172131.1 hypothetical protein [Magnetococcales bacterium]MBF0346694.1 hypothetical protein [Magnetococcales bacterium]MBF0629906.1 hypothetical protein [Magnetococcales bacterium]